MSSRRTSGRTRKSRERMLALKVSSPRIVMFDAVKYMSRFAKLGVWIVVMVVVGFFLSYGWQRLFVENDDFQIKMVDLKTMDGEDPRFLNHERLGAQTGLDPGTTIFSVDTDALRDAILELPEITAAKVSRRLPGKLKVQVTERQPVAWVACRSLGIKERDRKFGLLVDENYIPFPCASEKLWEYADDLPVVMVRDAEHNEIVSGEPISNTGLRYAIDLVKLSTEKLEGAERPAWVVVKDDIMLEMQTLDGVLATLSYYEQEDQLTRFTKITAHAREQDKSLSRINLIPSRFVPVHYR